MSRGYGEGPATDERLDALERATPSGRRARPTARQPNTRRSDFLGWLGEVDPDELFESGRASGPSVVRRPA